MSTALLAAVMQKISTPVGQHQAQRKKQIEDHKKDQQNKGKNEVKGK
jgi:hypothetical protein